MALDLTKPLFTTKGHPAKIIGRYTDQSGAPRIVVAVSDPPHPGEYVSILYHDGSEALGCNPILKNAPDETVVTKHLYRDSATARFYCLNKETAVADLVPIGTLAFTVRDGDVTSVTVSLLKSEDRSKQ